jgi:hypothetical protein
MNRLYVGAPTTTLASGTQTRTVRMWEPTTTAGSQPRFEESIDGQRYHLELIRCSPFIDARLLQVPEWPLSRAADHDGSVRSIPSL